MTEIDEKDVQALSRSVTRVGRTYCVHMNAHYVTTIGRPDKGLAVTVHMTEDEARDLCIGLKDALQ